MIEGILELVLWNGLGGLVCLYWGSAKNTEGWELSNPYWAHHYHKSVNWLGATLISLVYTALCPIGAACYWLYKICTVGRN